MSAPIFAQFTTPFLIADRSLSGYKTKAFMRVPRDKGYTPPTPERASRGWLVVRSYGGMELFRADVNLFMDGGVGVLTDDHVNFTDALIKSSATLLEPQQAAEVLQAILTRIETMHSPWAQIEWGSRSQGVECFHEDVKGTRTPQKFVVDLRLERVQ